MIDLAGREHEFVWTSQAEMYRFTPIGQDIVPPKFGWWMPTLFWWGVAAVLAVSWAGRRALDARRRRGILLGESSAVC